MAQPDTTEGRSIKIKNSPAGRPMPSTNSETSPPSADAAGSISLAAKRTTCFTSSTNRPITSPDSAAPSKIRPRRVKGRSSRCKVRRKSKTVTSRPRTLHTPTTLRGARGTTVMGGGLRISLMRVSSTPYSSPASENIRNSRTGPRSPMRRAKREAVDCVRLATGALQRARGFDARQHLFDQTRRIQHQADALVTQLGRASEAPDARQRFTEGFDHDVFLSVQEI